MRPCSLGALIARRLQNSAMKKAVIITSRSISAEMT
jgi:hypothetical protein